jgi:hypothetical protein
MEKQRKFNNKQIKCASQEDRILIILSTQLILNYSCPIMIRWRNYSLGDVVQWPQNKLREMKNKMSTND